MNSKSKDQKYKHLILFDDTCPLCQRAVEHILKIDRDKLFLFSSLRGKTAQKLLKKKYLSLNTLVLVENYQSKPKISIRSRAIARIYILIGGWRKIFKILPVFLGDPIYRIIARHRHHLTTSKKRKFSLPEARYLP